MLQYSISLTSGESVDSFIKEYNTTLEKAKCIPWRTVDALNKLMVEGQDILIVGIDRIV